MPSQPHTTPHLPTRALSKPLARRLLSEVARRAQQWRATQLINSALTLADEPSLVLDLPCAADGFWPLLSSSDSRVVIAANADAEHLTEALTRALTGLHSAFTSRVHALQSSVFAIELDANAVDCIFCMHCLHQVDDPLRRMALLQEFNRVTRDSVIISVWVDGNLEALGHKQRDGQIYPRRQIEREFIAAGFTITGHRDFIPGLAMLRLYVLHKRG